MTQEEVIKTAHNVFLQYKACVEEGYEVEAYTNKHGVYEDLITFIMDLQEIEL